jgi:hypothetical protein
MKDLDINQVDWITDQVIKIREELKEELNRIEEEEK